MFRAARIKLTGWYLFIITLISVFFSVMIYIGAVRELKRGFNRAELRFKAEKLGILLPRRFSSKSEDLPLRLKKISPHFLLVEDFQIAKKRLALNLLLINAFILAISTGASYFLAGKTLQPIEKTMAEQKRFVTDASHELRTPLTALKTSMEVALRDKKMSLEEAKKVIKSNLKDVNDLKSLSNNLLSLADYQDNWKNIVFQNVDIARIIKNSHRKILPLAKKKKIDLKIKTKKHFISANQKILEEMMFIFLDNAIKYTPKMGKVIVKEKIDKKHLFIEIKDNGMGIAKKDIPHIFDRFYRVDQSRSKSSISGFGLGLSLAKKMIEIHKGSVKVISKMNKGTSFIIKLPLKHS